MPILYTTRPSDMLDLIVLRHYRRQDGRLVERVLDVNRGMADYGPVLPAEVKILLPDPPPSVEPRATIRLWD